MSDQKHTVLGVLAHVDAGKTTLSEQILYRCGTLRSAGRVDEQSAYLDYAGVERRRGITVFADQAGFVLDGRSFNLVDTPGHVDFSGEMERCLSVLDCAVLVVSSVEGVQAHTETLWGLLRSSSIPVMVFLNKVDRAGADPAGVFSQLEALFGTSFCDFTNHNTPEPAVLFSPETAEALAGMDDTLLEVYLSTGFEPELWLQKARELFRRQKLFPVFCGSALKGEGLDRFLLGVGLFAPEPPGDARAPFSGRVYKVRHDKGGRVAYLKVEQGVLHPKDTFFVPGGEEKCNELRVYSGAKFELVKEAWPGMLCAVTGIQTARAGDSIGENAREGTAAALRPLLASKVLFDAARIPPPLMLSRFRELEDEEPLLGVAWSERAQEIEVRIMGEIQLEVLTELVKDRWNEEISFGPCTVLYRETLTAPVVGVGHFEPLRHYAEVHLRISPAPRGNGVRFQSECPLDNLPSNYQNLVQTHVLEKTHLGVLTGAPLADVMITLLSGAYHLKHTEGGDFREAVYRAIRQGLMHGESLLLEPYYHFTVETAYEEIGRVQSDMARLEGECEAPEEENGRMLLRGRGPVRTLMNYPRELTAFTKGRGRISFSFGGFEPCRDAGDIIREIAYEPERDLENTPDSVFCSHGAGFPVKWNEASAHMHLPVEKT